MRELYASNRLAVTRQVPCHPGRRDTVDLLFSLNGLPVGTCELKNPATGQDWNNAVRQYMNDRDPRCPLFGFKKRALVHFAADPDEVHMSTRLRGGDTVFLPFNRGSSPGDIRCGAGNPVHPSGYRSGYFWEEVLERDSFLDILGRFMFVETKDEKVDDGKGGSRLVTKETMVFPRYHQLAAVRGLVAAAAKEGAGRNYLIQHSAGSGKTNSISWLSHRLASLHTAEDAKVFDCVVVITDRRVLDRQLQDAIYQIEHAQGVVKAIDQDSRQLAEALIDGTKIVITTRNSPSCSGGSSTRQAPRRPRTRRPRRGHEPRPGRPKSRSGATPSSSTRRTRARAASPRGSSRKYSAGARKTGRGPMTRRRRIGRIA